MDFRDSSTIQPETSEVSEASAASTASAAPTASASLSGERAEGEAHSTGEQGSSTDDTQHHIEPPAVAPLYTPRTQSQASGGNNPFRRLQPVLRLDDGDL